jgi:hypothetical protein
MYVANGLGYQCSESMVLLNQIMPDTVHNTGGLLRDKLNLGADFTARVPVGQRLPVRPGIG